MRIRSLCRIAFAFAVAALQVSQASFAEEVPAPYITITRYPHARVDKVPKPDGYEDVTVNSVLRIPKWNRMCRSLMREVTYARPDWDVPEPTEDCDSDLRDFLWSKREELVNLWAHNTFDGDSDAWEIYPTVFVTRLNGNGQLGLVTRNSNGGSGGHNVNWALYIIKESQRAAFSLPEQPNYQGVEFQPGGNVWVHVNCNKKESDEHCARRLLFPPLDASRLIFGHDKVRNGNLGKAEKLPLAEE